MPRKRGRAYWVMVVGIALITVLERYASTVFLERPVDGVIGLIWRFTQCGAVWCVGEDIADVVRAARKARTKWLQ